MGSTNQPSNVLDQIKELRRQVAELRKNRGIGSTHIRDGELTLSGDAVLRMVDDSDVEVMYFGPDGLGRQVMAIRREGGSTVLYTGFTLGGDQFWRLTDRFNRELFSDDTVTGGMARPYLPVQMFPQFTMAAGTHAYMNIAVASITSETQLWEGRIGLVSHPYFSLAGVWGAGSGTSTTTYRVKITGTTVASWTSTAIENNTKGPFSMAAYLGQQEVPVTVTAQSSGTGQVACQLFNFTQRQTP